MNVVKGNVWRSFLPVLVEGNFKMCFFVLEFGRRGLHKSPKLQLTEFICIHLKKKHKNSWELYDESKHSFWKLDRWAEVIFCCVTCGWGYVMRALGLFHRTMWQTDKTTPPRIVDIFASFFSASVSRERFSSCSVFSQVRRASWALGDDNQTTSTSQSFMWKQHSSWNKCQRPTMIQRNEIKRSAAMYGFLWGFPFHLRESRSLGIYTVCPFPRFPKHEDTQTKLDENQT